MVLSLVSRILVPETCNAGAVEAEVGLMNWRAEIVKIVETNIMHNTMADFTINFIYPSDSQNSAFKVQPFHRLPTYLQVCCYTAMQQTVITTILAKT